MSESTSSNPCIMFALSRESMFFRRHFRPRQRFPGAPCYARFCRSFSHSVLVMHTGMGADAAKQAIDWALGKPTLGDKSYSPKFVIMAGFAGALDRALRIGDIVAATGVGDEEGNAWPTTLPAHIPGGKWETTLQRGKIVTVDRVVDSPSGKTSLSQKYQASAVDMESAHVARACRINNMPFGCIRAISDAVDTQISKGLVRAFSGNRVSWFHVLSAVLRSPKVMLEMKRLTADTRHASQQLGLALRELLPQILSRER